MQTFETLPGVSAAGSEVVVPFPTRPLVSSASFVQVQDPLQTATRPLDSSASFVDVQEPLQTGYSWADWAAAARPSNS